VTATDTTDEDSRRRGELLDATYGRLLGADVVGTSLPALAAAVGAEPRALLDRFGTEDGLVRALLARARTDQLRVLDALPDDAGLATAGGVLWAWLAAPEHRSLLRLWLGAYSRSLGEADGPWTGFARTTVGDWDLLLAAHQPTERVSTPAGTAERALLLAVLRGALLDLLATDDVDRAGAAVAAHLRTLGAVPDDGPRPRLAREGAGGTDRDGE
jgi:AcrR family transcriptional regulator